MKKSAAGFCKRLHGSIGNLYGEDTADEVCGEGVASSAPAEAKGQWACEAMGALEARFDLEARKAVMAPCACGPRPAQLAGAEKKYKGCKSLEEFAEMRNRELDGAARFEARGGLLYVSYPRCYCAMVKNAPGPVPKTWCLCSCEYIRRFCSAALGNPVEVKPLKSVIGGDDECMFEVRIL